MAGISERSKPRGKRKRKPSGSPSPGRDLFPEASAIHNMPTMTVAKGKKPAQKRMRRAPLIKPTRPKPIPKSYEECSAADRMLIDLRNAGMDWPEVRKAYAKFTGEEHSAVSSLPNRYSRLVRNFTQIPEDDQPKLIKAKMQVDEEFDKQRWRKVQAAMLLDGAPTYAPEVLERVYKRLVQRGEHLLEHGVDPGPSFTQSGDDDDKNDDNDDDEHDSGSIDENEAEDENEGEYYKSSKKDGRWEPPLP